MAGPSLPTIKKLFAKSSNRCAYPGCQQGLITAGVLTGEVCHIRAHAPGGPRFDAAQADDERHAEENLVLMCPGHHKVIDSDVARHTAAALLKMKADHEAAASGPISITDEDATEFLVQIRMIMVSSFNQSGGQTAQTIVNIISPSTLPASAVPLWSNEQALSVQHSLLRSTPPAFIDISIMPSLPIAPSSRLGPAELTEAVVRSRADFGLGFPYVVDDPIERHPSPEGVFLAKTLNMSPYVETWTMFSTGYFRLSRVPLEDLRRQTLRGKNPTEYLDWLLAVALIGESLVFAARLMKKLKVSGVVNYELRLQGMRDRFLRDSQNAIHFDYQCNAPTITLARSVNVDELVTNPTAEALSVMKELVTMFHWDSVTEEVLMNRFKALWARTL